MDMSTTMDPASIVAVLAATACVLCILFAPRVIRATLDGLRDAMLGDMKEASKLLVDLRSMQARAAGTIRTAERRVGKLQQVNGLPLGNLDADDLELDVPDWLIAAARGAGIDPQALLNGDPAQQAKLKAVMAGIKKETGAPAAADGLPPGDMYL